MTLEAFADTIVPGEKRSPDDRAVAGASHGGGAVAAGAVTLLRDPAGGLSVALDTLVEDLNEHAAAYATEHGVTLDADVPPFVALSFADRTALVQRLLAPQNEQKELWVGLALFSNMAFDSAAHLNTVDALREGHPGLLAMGYFPPDDDGYVRFSEYSYGRPLGRPHPNTTPCGSPA